MGSQKPNIMLRKLFKLHTKTQNNSNHVTKNNTIIDYNEKKGKGSHLGSHRMSLL
jgi:hypothetical protein